MKGSTALAVMTVRNEAAFLLEWLAHHKAVGFDRFLILSNDCQDGTDDMLDRLQDMGHVTHIRNDGPYHKGGIQFTALKRADETEIVKTADWILALDADEFVNIHTGDGTLPALWSALPEATAITLTWRLFGNAGVTRFTDTPILETFTRATPEIMHWPWRTSMFKTLFKNTGVYRKLGVHRPRSPDRDRLDEAKWFDGEGRALPGYFRTQRLFSPFSRPNYGLVQLNHYPLGALESYVLKVARGRAVHESHMLGMDYWVERNFNTDEDVSIHRYKDRSRPILDRLKSDPDLAELHQNAVAWRHRRFEELLGEEPYRALFGRLMMTPPSQPIARDAAKRLWRAAAKSNFAKWHRPETD